MLFLLLRRSQCRHRQPPENLQRHDLLLRDGLGNLIHRELADGEVQNYFYDLHDQLVKAEIFKKDGSHLLQEIHSDGRYTYIYTEPDGYEPLAQVHNHTSAEGESCQEVNYFHCDHIGIPREMTDKDGKLLWFRQLYRLGSPERGNHGNG